MHYRNHRMTSLEKLIEEMDPTGFSYYERLGFEWCKLRIQAADIEYQKLETRRKRILAEKQLINRLENAMNTYYEISDCSEDGQEDVEHFDDHADEILARIKKTQKRRETR